MVSEKPLFPLAMNINFDSLGFYLGYSMKDRDPSFFQIAQRFLKYAEKHDFKYTIFVIGKDLEDSANARQVKVWSDMGHEIGNHSYNHSLGLSGMNYADTEREIMQSHEIITRTTGVEPKGFIAPGWSTSKNVYKVLLDNGYEYDTSCFPSLAFYLVLLKVMFNNRKSLKVITTILNRKDWLYHPAKTGAPFFMTEKGVATMPKEKALVVLPVPTRSRFRIPLWHTTGFLFGEGFVYRNLKFYLSNTPFFYYLTHPFDLLSPEDLPDEKMMFSMERSNVEIDRKIKYLSKVMDMMHQSGRGFVTLREQAEQFRMSHL